MKKKIRNNQMLTLYQTVWYRLEKLGLLLCLQKSNSDKKTLRKHIIKSTVIKGKYTDYLVQTKYTSKVMKKQSNKQLLIN